jgi:Uma2 family endonuclease
MLSQKNLPAERAMSAMPKPMTLDDFVAWEERQELRWEFDGVDARAMTGGTLAHSTIQTNLVAALRNALRGKPCRAHGSELKVRTASSIRYPDALVTCLPGDPKSTFAPDPTIVFEILSPRSADLDLGAKKGEYQSIAQLHRYVVLHQAQAAAQVFHRGEDGEWSYDFIGEAGVLEMPEAEIAISLAEIYEGVF